MLKNKYPRKGELVVCKVVKIESYSVRVNLEEYGRMRGSISISQIANGWVRNIRNHVKEEQRVVCKVLNSDPKREIAWLSLKGINAHQKRSRIQDWKKEQRANKWIENMKGRGEEIPNVEDLINRYDSLYNAFEDASYSPEEFRDKWDGEWVEPFMAIGSKNIQIQKIEIKGTLYLECPSKDGIEKIREALHKFEDTKDEEVNIDTRYSSAPVYEVKVDAMDYKVAESELKKALNRAEKVIDKHNGELRFERLK